MKKKLILPCAIFIVLALVSCSRQMPRTVNVSGTGSVTFLPDTVTFSVTVSNLKPKMAEAVSATGGTIKEILSVCADFGIADTNIKTGYVNTGKKYERAGYNSPEVFIGYSAEQTVQIKYRDLPQFERFSEALLSLDITSLNNVHFSHSDVAKYESEANLLALDDAALSAEKMAARMNMKLGKALHITDILDTPSFRNEYANGPMLARASADFGGVEISPGILTASGAVQIVFELK